MFAPTYVLGLTTIAEAVDKESPQIKVASTSGLTAGMRIWADRELMSVVSLGVSSLVNVRRGVDGTLATAHSNGTFAAFGPPDQFYETDPQGSPPIPALVVPYINIRTGDAWVPQGDEGGKGPRWWSKATATYSQGALGVWRVTYSPINPF